MRKQVHLKAASAAELERWKAEAKRRGWTLTQLVRSAVNAEVERGKLEQQQAGAA